MTGHGQARLTRGEVRRLRTTNQYGDGGLTVVEWQVVKGAAVDCEVPDWTARADGSLTYGENVALMERYGAAPSAGPTMREMPRAGRRAYSDGA